MSTAVRALLLAALLTLAPVTIGVIVSGDETVERQPVAYEATDLADFDTSAAVVRRAPFCELLPQAAVDAAVGEGAELTELVNGEESEVIPTSDVAHEYGCQFAAAGETNVTATAWVFAPPVTAARAQELVEETPRKGCTTPADAPAYGTPSLAQVCTTKGEQTASWRGLFGDAWLTCTFTVPAGAGDADDAGSGDLTERAGRWCVAVAEAASAPLAETGD